MVKEIIEETSKPREPTRKASNNNYFLPQLINKMSMKIAHICKTWDTIFVGLAVMLEHYFETFKTLVQVLLNHLFYTCCLSQYGALLKVQTH